MKSSGHALKQACEAIWHAHCTYWPEMPTMQVDVFDTLASTQDAVHHYVNTCGLNYVPQLVIALEQTAGRGQYQRQWVSTRGNISFSCLLPLKHDVTGAFSLELACNLLTQTRLQHVQGIGLKWPNDIEVHHKKLGGLLIEAVNSHWVIIGLGLNVEHAPILHDKVTTSLADYGVGISAEALIPELFAVMVHTALQFPQKALAQRFTHVDALFNQLVDVVEPHVPESPYRARADGIADDGQLKVYPVEDGREQSAAKYLMAATIQRVNNSE